MTSTKQFIDLCDGASSAAVADVGHMPYTAASPLPDTPVDRSSLSLFADYLRSGAKTTDEWRTGIEIEVFGFKEASSERINAAEVQDLLRSFAESGGGLVNERGVPVEAQVAGSGRITIEPGGQVEFSGSPRFELADSEADLRSFFARLGSFANERGIAFAATGFDPLTRLEDQHWYPKERYELMRPYLAKQGVRAWDMMSRTCAIQVNVDYGSETDFVSKFFVGNRLAPVVTAMFANSPFEQGRLSGFKSTRAAVWLQTDNARSGVSPAATAQLSFEAFVDYAISIPMFFIRRQGRYLNAVSGLKFGDYLRAGNEPNGAIFQDWTDHLSTIFTEARLKQYIELRSIDSGSLEMSMAAQALWKGLLYDESTLQDVLRLVPGLSGDGWSELQRDVAVNGLAARACGINVLELARDLVELSTAGLKRIAPGEMRFLDPIRQLVCDEGICPADILLRNWHGRWHGSISSVLDYMRVA
jgi:glutamate--cysteine ligase